MTEEPALTPPSWATPAAAPLQGKEMLAETQPAPSLPLRCRAVRRNETPPACRGLLLRRVSAPNTYMDNRFRQLPPTEAPKHLYSNAERLQQLVTTADASCPPPCNPQGEEDGLPPSACPWASSGLPSAAAELGPSSARAAQETRVRGAHRRWQQRPARAGR